jgi:hypothetical protein
MLVHDIDDLTVSRFIAVRRSERKRRGVRKVRRVKKGEQPAPPPALVSNATVNREVELLKRLLRFLSGPIPRGRDRLEKAQAGREAGAHSRGIP